MNIDEAITSYGTVVHCLVRTSFVRLDSSAKERHMNRRRQLWLVVFFIALFLQSAIPVSLNAQLFINLQDQSPASVTFSPDGKYILSGGHDGTIRLWDSATGKGLYLIYIDKPQTESDETSLPSDVMSVGFSPDSRLFAAGIRDRTVRVYGTATGLELLSLKNLTKEDCAQSHLARMVIILFLEVTTGEYAFGPYHQGLKTGTFKRISRM